MNKSERMDQFIKGLGAPADPALDPCYTGFFQCFNDQLYYEAHDVLEHLWLQTRDENHAYFKGLIQVAGAFVHLKKQFLRPAHPTDGRRLHPAVRLFRLAMKNLDPFRPRHMRFEVEALIELCARHVDEITAANFAINPWHPTRAPVLQLLAE